MTFTSRITAGREPNAMSRVPRVDADLNDFHLSLIITNVLDDFRSFTQRVKHDKRQPRYMTCPTLAHFTHD